MPRGTRKADPGSASSGALRTLVGAGPSQVGIVGALRARDVSRPSQTDVLRAADQAAGDASVGSSPRPDDRGEPDDGGEPDDRG